MTSGTMATKWIAYLLESLASVHVYNFTDLILWCSRLFQDPVVRGALAGRYNYISVDEM